MGQVIIGTDPHKRSTTIEVRDEREILLATGRFPVDKTGYRQLLGYVRQWPNRVWAVEGAHGAGRPLGARLLADGETVLDVPAKRPVPRPQPLRLLDRSRPIDASSGEQIRHRLSRAGNRRLNHVLYIAAVCQIRHDTPGRRYYQRKLAEGKTPLEALRCLRRRLSNVAYRQLVADAAKANQADHGEAGPGGQRGATTDSSAAGPTPTAGPSDKPQPGPAPQTLPGSQAGLEPSPASAAAPPRRRARGVNVERPTGRPTLTPAKPRRTVPAAETGC